MKISLKSGCAALSLLTVVALGSFRLNAEEPTPASPASAPAIKRTYDPARRVPIYFGEIGLTAEQKEAIYKLRARHLQKIEDLEKQIVQAKVAMIAECETVLTDSQKQLLEHRRKAALEAKKTRDTSGAASTTKK